MVFLWNADCAHVGSTCASWYAACPPLSRGEISTDASSDVGWEWRDGLVSCEG